MNYVTIAVYNIIIGSYIIYLITIKTRLQLPLYFIVYYIELQTIILTGCNMLLCLYYYRSNCVVTSPLYNTNDNNIMKSRVLLNTTDYGHFSLFLRIIAYNILAIIGLAICCVPIYI